MDDSLMFSEAFIKSLDVLKFDTNVSLIYAIHIVSSTILSEDKKEQFCLELSTLGSELKNDILRFDIGSITKYTIGEKEGLRVSEWVNFIDRSSKHPSRRAQNGY